MINKELINIRNLIKIIIGILVICSMFQSCAKALTSQEVTDYINNTADYFTGNTTFQNIKSNSQKTHVINFINQYSGNFNNFAVWKSGSYYHYKFFNASNGKINSASDSLTYTGTYTETLVDNSSVIWTQTNMSQSNSSIDGGYSYDSRTNYENSLGGMSYITQEINGTTPNTWVGMQAVVPQVTIYFGHLFSTTITYNGEEMQANTLDYNYRIEFIENVVTDDNEITSMVATLDNKALEVQDMGSYWTLKENNSTTLKYNQIYTLNVQAIVNSKEEEIEEKVIFVPPGTTISGGVITSIPSGDYNFNTENATNQIIENQNQNQEDNQSFFENLYNKMLTPSGDKINSMITEAMNDLNMPSRRNRTSNSGT